tara:strand:- start:297 stop:569 length:273 start_codon:yes stop_codon:yes gene_type:complete
MKRGINIWDIIAWVVLAGILIWVLLKTFEIINTPLILEYAPIYGAIYLAGWQMHKLATVANDVKELKKFKDSTIKKINELETNCIKKHSK